MDFRKNYRGVQSWMPRFFSFQIKAGGHTGLRFNQYYDRIYKNYTGGLAVME